MLLFGVGLVVDGRVGGEVRCQVRGEVGLWEVLGVMVYVLGSIFFFRQK